MTLKRVDFPDPDGPTSATRDPVLISKLTWSNALKVPKFLERSSTNILIFKNLFFVLPS